jgi:hypothetical protein
MNKKYYCHECQELIEEGKQTKIKKGANYYHSRYSSWPRDRVTYYLCPKCYKQQREEMCAKRKKSSQLVIWISVAILLVLVLIVVWFFIYHYFQDRKIDRITKKNQKK